MPRVYTSPVRDAVYTAIDQCGLMTREDLQLTLGYDYNQVLGALRGLRRKKQIHIAKYTRQENKGGRCTPHYAVGDQPDAVELPQLTSKQRNTKYREAHRARINARNMARRGRSYSVWQGLMR